MTKLTGREAIDAARRLGVTLNKYADPTEGERVVTAEEAEEIMREDPSLLWLDLYGLIGRRVQGGETGEDFDTGRGVRTPAAIEDLEAAK